MDGSLRRSELRGTSLGHPPNFQTRGYFKGWHPDTHRFLDENDEIRGTVHRDGRKIRRRTRLPCGNFRARRGRLRKHEPFTPSARTCVAVASRPAASMSTMHRSAPAREYQRSREAYHRAQATPIYRAAIEEFTVMSLPFKIKIAFTSVVALLLAGMAMPGQAAEPVLTRGSRRRCAARATSRSPASRATSRPGKRSGSIIAASGSSASSPGGATSRASANAPMCGQRRQDGGTVYVIDVSDPAKPVEVRSVPVKYASETMRVVVTNERAVLVSGSSVYDIRDCLNPVLMGEIKWPPLAIGGNPPAGGGGGTGHASPRPAGQPRGHQGLRVIRSVGGRHHQSARPQELESHRPSLRHTTRRYPVRGRRCTGGRSRPVGACATTRPTPGAPITGTRPAGSRQP